MKYLVATFRRFHFLFGNFSGGHFAAVVFLLFAAGCSKVKDGPPQDVYPVCMDPIGVDLPRACCQNNNPAEAGSRCPVKDPGKSLIKDTIFAATCSLESAKQNLELANQLLGESGNGINLCSGPGNEDTSTSGSSSSSGSSGSGSGDTTRALTLPDTQYSVSSPLIPNTPIQPGGASEANTPISQAVTVEDPSIRRGLADTLSDLGFKGLKDLLSPTKSKPSSGSGGGSNAGGGISSGGNAQTASLPSSTQNDALDANATSSLYGAGGGGGGSGGKNSDNPQFSFGSFGNDGGPSAQSNRTDFRKPASKGVNPFRNPEDANQFAVLNADDNLFQKIHSRYQTEQAAWHGISVR